MAAVPGLSMKCPSDIFNFIITPPSTLYKGRGRKNELIFRRDFSIVLKVLVYKNQIRIFVLSILEIWQLGALIRRNRVFSPVSFPQKRRSRRPQIERFNMLESLPKDMLVKVLCKVDSSDLGQLLLVSKTVNEAALIARKIHHLYSTPTKRTFKWLDASNNFEDAPNAPMQHRVARSRIKGKNLACLAVDLFLNYDE
ncbi:hypothetical protein LUZ61_008813 [Rhynchospora tenuis]|uniref:F-box domain-containing protein n=1 Tax=Rhynchospora tenuis TaxID=198213 RepID=A0AAD5ZW81_9POAL|nr:hypothetical protein LUZ61_008813 [Rhynchospora tenuis]